VQPSVIPISELWYSRDATAWDAALERYWAFVQPRNLELERAMEHLDHDRIRGLTCDGWYTFLHDEYFRWKYTAPTRYATTTALLKRRGSSPVEQAALLRVRDQLLALNPSHIVRNLAIACKIPGLGTAGGSGLLSLLYPKSFGTVDQFVVKALRDVPSLPEAHAVARMKPEDLTARDAEVLIRIMRRQGEQLSEAFGVPWTPRAIDRVLWTYGRD
jgi:hypothetical protein